jgi:hypothetical protein
MESLGRTLIRNGCSGIVSSSRTSWYVLGWKDVQFGGNASLAYLFWEQLISNPQSVGDAISSAKIEYMKRFNSAWQHLHNIYAFNYFGDPTLVLTGQTPSYGGLSGSVFSGDGEAIPQQGIHVEIAGLSLSAETGKNGEFQFLCLPYGSYTLSFSGDDCPDFQTEVQIVAGEMKHIDISVPSSAAPAIQTSVSSLSITLHEDNIRETFLRVTNTGSDNLLIHTQRTDPDAGWLTVDSTQFDIPPGDCDSIRVSFQSLELDQGMFESQFQLITNIEENSIIPFPVSMTVIDTIPPAPINDLVMMEMENDSVTLVWTAPGDNNLTGKAEHYEIWMSEQEPNDPDTGNGVVICDTLTPNSAGILEQIRISLESSDQTRWIWIKTWDEAGFASNSNSINLVSTGISEAATTVPRDFVTQNYPNPFNGSTQIEFGISRPGKVRISVYNERGQFVKCLDDENLNAGHHTTAWHALDAYSRPVSSGIYFYTVETESQRVIQKMLLLK